MTTDLNQLRQRLQRERKRLIEELEQLKGSIRQASGQRDRNLAGKWDESGMESSEADRCLALQTRVRESLTEVERALHKLEDGSYGLCDNCGQQIDPARLEALPQANLCLSCKAHQAKNAKGRSPPR